MIAATGPCTLLWLCIPFAIPSAKSRTTISFALRSRSSHEIPFPRMEKNRKSRFPVSSPNTGIFSKNLDCRRVLLRNSYDPDLRAVLELASDEELLEIEEILFGRSYFSPLLKSFTVKSNMDYGIYMDHIEQRDYFIDQLESRFLFLAADAHSTIRGWRPSYRNILLRVRKKLHVPCSGKLSTVDLEVQIYLHLLKEYSRNNSFHFPWDSNGQDKLVVGLSSWKVHTFAALKSRENDVKQMVLKGSGIYTLRKMYQSVAMKLSGKLMREAANYHIKHEIIKKGGQLAAISLDSRAALLAARSGYVCAVSRYFGFRSLIMLLGPVLWGTLLADVMKQMLGTDYARILRAIYAFTQIRLLRTHG
ncbi:hypothetical protein ZOSMA_13G00380 [Zostera marina]|uniref:Uncharacterized protein n=1 Tax=Zostera marina TaxID=29655 RepID=A0A0K9Q010_ZOSMR|nr:hypothetical protein ZOSMA_13G00380 [Zostera marina]